MKIAGLIILIALSCSIHAAQQSQELSQVQKNNVNHALDDCTGQPFGPNSMLNVLLDTPRGRNLLLTMRIAESTIAQRLTKRSPQAALITSFYYDPEGPRDPIWVSKIFFKNNHTDPILLFVQNIINIERLLTYQDKYQLYNQEAYEKTRQLDLLLLKTMLEYDNDWNIQSIDYAILLEMVNKTHKKWPPQNSKNIYHPDSAYDVIKKAIAQRKNNTTDQINDADWVELWDHTVKHKSELEYED